MFHSSSETVRQWAELSTFNTGHCNQMFKSEDSELRKNKGHFTESQ